MSNSTLLNTLIHLDNEYGVSGDEPAVAAVLRQEMDERIARLGEVAAQALEFRPRVDDIVAVDEVMGPLRHGASLLSCPLYPCAR